MGEIGLKFSDLQGSVAFAWVIFCPAEDHNFEGFYLYTIELYARTVALFLKDLHTCIAESGMQFLLYLFCQWVEYSYRPDLNPKIETGYFSLYIPIRLSTLHVYAHV